VTGGLTIALDAMGGDAAPAIVVRGAELARERFPETRFLLFGDEQQIRPLLAAQPRLREVAEVRHTAERVTDDAKPSAALRTGRDTSMWRAIEAVRAGEAAAVVSAGNTGALMAIAKFVLRMPRGVDRPAICSFFPTTRGESVMLDLGANVECDAQNLVQFAVMGAFFARAVLGIERPTVGILNVGAEELKGHEAVRDAAAILRATPLPLEFEGFVEGDDIPAGTVDVIVTDGFTGNIALKTAEGTSRLYAEFLRHAFRSSWTASLGYLLARRTLQKLRERLDPRRYNGAVFLGLNGVAVKSHGGSDAFAFGNAVCVAHDMVTHGFLEGIRAELERMSESSGPPAEAATG
jgi:glycerol-3-phosphate acyltransferase PlsX